MHYSLDYVALILISIHIGLHWVSIMGFFKRIFNLKTFNKVRTIVLRIITLLIVIAGIRGSFQQNILTKIITGFNNDDEAEVASDLKVVGYTNKKQDEEKVTTVESTASQTLEEYLISLHCTGCSKHCPLSAPKCSVGTAQAEKAKVEYEVTTKQSQSTDNSASPQIFEDFLAALTCTLCPKHCLLTSSGCSKGEEQVAITTKEYYSNIVTTSEEQDESEDKIIVALADFSCLLRAYILPALIIW